MPTIVVDVMPKAELLDPQGKAVAGALARTGHGSISGVRVGKRFELTVDGPVDDAVKAEVCDECKTYLKIFHLEKDARMVPAADDLATLALDILVDEQGYNRLGPNLLLAIG